MTLISPIGVQVNAPSIGATYPAQGLRLPQKFCATACLKSGSKVAVGLGVGVGLEVGVGVGVELGVGDGDGVGLGVAPLGLGEGVGVGQSTCSINPDTLLANTPSVPVVITMAVELAGFCRKVI